MEDNNSNQPINPSEALFQPPLEQRPIKNQKNKIMLIAGIAILILIMIIAGGGYYLSINKNKTVSQNDSTSPVNAEQQNSANEKFKIVADGKELFINKSKLINPDNTKMQRIEQYEIAPDKSKIAILAIGTIGTYFLYLTDITGENFTFISLTDEIEWSYNSKYLAYISRAADAGPHRFYVYETESRMIKQLADKQLDNPIEYSNLQWGNDDKSISADYFSYKIPGGERIMSGKKTYLYDQFK